MFKRAACRCQVWQCEAWDTLVHHSKAPAKTIAELIGIPLNTLYCFTYLPDNPNNHHCCPDMALIVPATVASGNTILIDELARHVGCTPPRPKKASRGTQEELVHRSIEQMGETLQAITQISSGLSRDTKQAIRRKLRKLMQVIDDLDLKIGEPLRKLG